MKIGIKRKKDVGSSPVVETEDRWPWQHALSLSTSFVQNYTTLIERISVPPIVCTIMILIVYYIVFWAHTRHTQSEYWHQTYGRQSLQPVGRRKAKRSSSLVQKDLCLHFQHQPPRCLTMAKVFLCFQYTGRSISYKYCTLEERRYHVNLARIETLLLCLRQTAGSLPNQYVWLAAFAFFCNPLCSS